jgi:hypothetical protein
MHEFCCCEALKVFKIFYGKNCENGVERGWLKKVLKSCLKGFEKKEEKNKLNPFPFPFRPTTHLSSLPPFFLFPRAARFPFRSTRPSTASSLPLLSLPITDRWDPRVRCVPNLQPTAPPSLAPASHRTPAPLPRFRAPWWVPHRSSFVLNLVS